MIRKFIVLFCDNEHGTGDVTFPDLNSLDAYAVEQEVLKDRTQGQLRKDAKAEGWGRVNGGDYCPGCMENGL